MVFTYYVMGCADTEDFAKAEYIAESLMQRLPKMKCEIYPKTKEEWPDAVQEFQREVEIKYGFKFEGGHRWEALKSENILHMKAKQAMARGDGPKSLLGASANGRDVADELLAGHARWSKGSTQSASLPAVESVAAVVILINDLEAPATIAQMLDQPEEAIFVIPCKDAAMSEFVQGNAEYGLVKLGARVLWVVGCPSADFDLAFQQTKDALQMKEEPLWPEQATSAPLNRSTNRLQRRASHCTSLGDISQPLVGAKPEYHSRLCHLLRACVEVTLRMHGKFQSARELQQTLSIECYQQKHPTLKTESSTL